MASGDEIIRNLRPQKRDPETRYAVQRNQWDRRVVNSLEREMKEFVLASKDLHKVTDTGIEAMGDALMGMFKVQPHLKPAKDVRPSYLVNHRVMGEFLELNEYEGLHDSASGDPISAGLAAVAMEPELEKLFQRLEEERKQAQDLEDKIQEAEGMEDDIEELLEKMQGSGSGDSDGEEDGDGEAKDYQEQAERLAEQLEQLQREIDQGTQELEQSLDERQGDIAAGVTQALNDAQDQAEALQNADSWGLEKGSVRKMDPSARLELAKKLQSEKFVRMSELFGRMRNLAFNSQMQTTEYVPEEIYDLTQGHDLEHILPTELAFADDEVLALDFMRKYVENSLIQYALRGQEEVNKGDIILLEDGSSSMSGTRTIWSKAIGLALLKVSTMQHRGFQAIHFASTHQFVRFDFDTSDNELKLERDGNHYFGIDAVMNFAECSLNGGTDFMTPLSQALEILQAQYDENGATSGDIVFLTDGQCGVPPEFLEKFKAEQERLGFRVFGIAIETDPNVEPFKTICDGRVTSVDVLKDPKQLEILFGEL